MSLKNKRIAILIADGVEDLEFYVPYMRFLEEEAEVIAAAADLSPIRGKNGLKITPDGLIDDLSADDLFALVLPGGWAPDKLRRSENVINLVREMDAKGKIIGIICHGGSIAVSADVVRGRRATGSMGIKDDLLLAGATWVDQPAFREDHLVWGRVVADIPDFCRELIAAAKKAAGAD